MTADPASRERLELETRVLAAALRQSIECGDMEGSSLAHEQIFILLKACQELAGIASGGAQEPLMENSVDKNRSNNASASAQMPNINWVSDPGRNAYVPVEPSSGESDINGESEVRGDAEASEQTDFAPLASAEAQTEISQPPGNISVPPPETLKDTMASDFTSPAPRSGTILDPRNSSEIETPLSETSQTVKFAGPDFYGMLDVEEDASGDRIHLQFLLRVRSTLRFIKDREEPLRGQERQKVLKNLQTIWIAHDVLLDPATRSDYDYRRTGEDATAGEGETQAAAEKNIRIGELLQSSGLLEKTELEIAADMHKAMPELMFGAFLVKQGFVQEEDLECVLIAQQLIKGGDISLVQFLEIMEERGGTSLSFTALLLAKQIITSSRLREIIATLPSEEAGIIGLGAEDAELAMGEAAAGATNVRDSVEASPASAGEENANRLDLGKAAPSWKDQLDWSMADEEEETGSKAEPAQELNPAAENADKAEQSEEESKEESEDAEELQYLNHTEHADHIDHAEYSRQPKAARAIEETKLESENLSDLDESASAPLDSGSPANVTAVTNVTAAAANFAHNENAAEATPPPEPVSDMVPEENDARSATGEHRARKRSLIDLIVDLKSPEALTATPEEEPAEDLFSALEEKRSREEHQVTDVEIPSLDEELFGKDGQESGSVSSQFEQELSDFDLTPQPQAAQVDPASNTSNRSTGEPGENDAGLDLPLPDSVEDLEELEALQEEFAEEESSSQTDTSSDVPALKPEDVRAHLEKDSWSIVSMPASYLASFLMDEDNSAAKQKKDEQSNNDDKNKDKDPRNRFKRNKRK